MDNVLLMRSFKKTSCETNFLNFYHVLSATSEYLLFKAKNLNEILKNFYPDKSPLFQLLKGHELNQTTVTWARYMEKTLNTELNEWQTFFKLERKICKENKLRELQFTFLHRIVVTKKACFVLEYNRIHDCLFCCEEDSMEHAFINCRFVQSFRESVFRWFNSKNNSNLKVG